MESVAGTISRGESNPIRTAGQTGALQADYDRLMERLPNDADELFALPLDQFTSRKKQIVAQLKAAGDKEGAARVAAMKKPSLSVWALNRVSRQHPDAVTELIQAGEALASPGSRTELRKASEKRQRAVSRIAQLAMAILKEEGHAGSSTMENKIEQALLGFGTDVEARLALAAGRLSNDLLSSGQADEMWGITTMSLSRDDQDEGSDSKRKRKEALDRELGVLADAADRARREAHELKERAHKARNDAEKAEAEAERAQRKADAATAAVERKKKIQLG